MYNEFMVKKIVLILASLLILIVPLLGIYFYFVKPSFTKPSVSNLSEEKVEGIETQTTPTITPTLTLPVSPSAPPTAPPTPLVVITAPPEKKAIFVPSWNLPQEPLKGKYSRIFYFGVNAASDGINFYDQ